MNDHLSLLLVISIIFPGLSLQHTLKPGPICLKEHMTYYGQIDIMGWVCVPEIAPVPLSTTTIIEY